MSGSQETSRRWQAQPPSRRLANREWRYRNGARRSRFSKRTRLGIFGLMLLGVTALIAYLLFQPRTVPQARVIAFGVSDYPNALPLNPYAQHDVQAFAVLHEDNPQQFPDPPAFWDDVLYGSALLQRLDELRGSFAGQNVLVFCSLHAVARPGGADSGGAEFYTLDSDVNAERTLPLRDLIRGFRESSAKHVVLLLDAGRMPPNWRLGSLTQEFAEQLPRDLAHVDDGLRDQSANSGAARQFARLSVLCASGPAERSWTSPEWEQSSFAHFCLEALRGNADGWGPRGDRDHRPDRRVSLSELHEYLRDHVADWAQTHRGASQSVLLLGDVSTPVDLVALPSPKSKVVPLNEEPPAEEESAKDTTKADAQTAEAKPSPHAKAERQPADLAAKDAPPKKSEPQASPVKDPAKRLAELWDRRDRLRKRNSAASRAPHLWRAAHAQLMLAEEQLRYGLPDKAHQTLDAAEQAVQKLEAAANPTAVINPQEEELAQSLGFFPVPLTDSVREAVSQSVQTLAIGNTASPSSPQTKPTSPTAESTSPAPLPNATAPPPPSSEQIVSWILDELRRDRSPRQLAKLAVALPMTERDHWPSELIFLDEFARRSPQFPADAAELAGVIVGLHANFRDLLVKHPEALPFVREDLAAGLRALDAGERWLLADGGANGEARRWILDRASPAFQRVREGVELLAEAIRLRRELLTELPAYACWIAQRAEDRAIADVDWSAVQAVAIALQQAEDEGAPEDQSVSRKLAALRPADQGELERNLLDLMRDARQLGKELYRHESATGQASILTDLRSATDRTRLHRREFELLVQQRVATTTRPDVINVETWQEADRLWTIPWLDHHQRDGLRGVFKEEPSGGVLLNTKRQPREAGLWHGFWAIQALSLAGCEPRQTERLWREWQSIIAEPRLEGSEGEERGRQHRLQLERSINESWKELAAKLRNGRTFPEPTIEVLAAGLDGFDRPEVDPDQLLREQRREKFAQWLTLQTADWRRRQSSSAHLDLARRGEQLLAALGHPLPETEPSASPMFAEIEPIRFDADRRGELKLQTQSGSTDDQPLRVRLEAFQVQIFHTDGTELQVPEQTVPRDGAVALRLQLPADMVAPQPLLVAILDQDGFPWDIRQAMLQPPFDPTQWRVEFRSAASNLPVYDAERLSRGVKLFLPPSGVTRLQAMLIRPAKDTRPSIDVAVFHRTATGDKALIAERKDLPLPSGQSEILLTFEPPAAPPPSEPADPTKPAATTPPPAAAPTAPATPPSPPAVNISNGLIFRLTPRGEEAFEYEVQPTFWSADAFVEEPHPEYDGVSIQIPLQRKPIPQDGHDRLLPPEISAELTAPRDVMDTAVGKNPKIPALAIGSVQELSLTLSPAAQERYDTQPLEVAVSVAGSPHAFRWKLRPNRPAELLTGRPPVVRITSPVHGQMLRAGKDALRVELQVTAAMESPDDQENPWTLSYEVIREEGGQSFRIDGGSPWRMTDSVDRQIDLTGLRTGVWQIATAVSDFQKEIATEGWLGRYRLVARLSHKGVPQASHEVRFAVDDERPPLVQIVNLPQQHLFVQNLPVELRFEDRESGLQRIAFGFDLNNNQQLDETERFPGSERTLVPIENTREIWKVAIPAVRLPQTEGRYTLLAVATNGLGTEGESHAPIVLTKPVTVTPTAPAKPTTGNLTVTFRVGGTKTVRLSGPKTGEAKVSGASHAFTNLPAGEYTVDATGYLGVKGTAKATVEAGKTNSVSVDLK